MSLFSGTSKLFRLALRTDRLKLTIWIVGCAATFFASTLSVIAFYNTPEEINGYATVSTVSVASRAFNGPILGATKESVVLTETFSFFTLFVAFMNTLLVVRHTRQEEETGRAELIGGAAVGAFAPLVSTMLLAFCVNVVLAVTVAYGYLICDFELSGAVLAGAAMGLMGMVFASIAALAAQVTQTARAANAIAGGSIGLFFLIRAIGDTFGTIQPSGVEVKSSWLTMLSPMGLARETQPFIRDNIWPIWFLLAIILVVAALACILLSRRDLGSGMLAVRPGPPVASRSLSSALGLVWRQQRGLLLGWSVGVILMAIALGSMAKEVEKITSSSAEMTQFITVLGGSQNLVKAYLAYSMSIFGVMVTGYAIQAMQKIRTEESDSRLELILAGSVRRSSWLLSNVFVVALGSVVLLFLCGITAGITHGLIVNDVQNQIWPMIEAGLVQLPALFVFVGMLVLIFSVIPKLTLVLSWLIFSVCYVVMQFGEIFKLPKWIVDLSPFSHTPAVPAEDLTWTPIITMTAIAAAMIIAGVVLFKRRNLTTV